MVVTLPSRLALPLSLFVQFSLSLCLSLHTSLSLLLSHSLTASRHIEDEEKLRVWVKTARFFIAFDENVQADKYTNRAGQLLKTSTSPPLATAYKECFATCQDYKRKFKEAARNYYVLACDPSHRGLPAAVREEHLRKACLCTILERAGEQRSRMLSTLYKDERCKKLDVFPMLQDMHLERRVAREEVAAFAGLLKPHQQALLADGSTVLEHAVVMHNLRASSRVYTNISFEELAKLLETSEEKVPPFPFSLFLSLHGLTTVTGREGSG